MAAGVFGRAVQPCVVCPLVENVDLYQVGLVEHGVLRKHGKVQRGQKFVDAVVDFVIDVVGPAGKYYNLLALRPCLCGNFGALCAHVGVVLIEAGEAVIQRLCRILPLYFIFFERRAQLFDGVFALVQIDVRHYEVFFVQPLVVGLQQLGVIRHDGAVVMVYRIVLVEVIAFAGHKYEVYALIQKAFYMAVDELCRVAGGIGSNRVLAAEIQLARGLVRQHYLEAKAFEEACPDGQLFIHTELQGKPHLYPARVCASDYFGKALLLVGVDIEVGRGRFAARAPFALVARYVARTVGKGDYVDVAL